MDHELVGVDSEREEGDYQHQLSWLRRAAWGRYCLLQQHEHLSSLAHQKDPWKQ